MLVLLLSRRQTCAAYSTGFAGLAADERLSVRRYLYSDMSTLPIMSSSTPPAGPGMSVSPVQLVLAAHLLVEAFSEDSGWHRRRVETVAFEGHRAKRTISIDADVPLADHQVPVPIALFGKEEALVNADVRDDEGRALPLLTQEEATAVGYVALQLAISDVGEELTPEEDELLLDLVVGSRHVATNAYHRLCDSKPAWLDYEYLGALARLLAEHIVFFALLDVGAGRRRVLKLAWEETVRGGGLRSVGAGLIALRGRLRVTFHSLPTTAFSHFEVTAPYGTEINGVTMLNVDSDFGVDFLGGSTACLHGATRHAFQPQRAIISLSASGPLLRTAIGAASLMFLALITAVAFPDVRGGSPILVALLSLPIAVLLREATVLRAHDTGFAGAFVFGPLVLTLVLVLVVEGFVVAGVDSGYAQWLFVATGVSLLTQLILFRGLFHVGTKQPASLKSKRVGREMLDEW